jgi:hypothetical protein
LYKKELKKSERIKKEIQRKFVYGSECASKGSSASSLPMLHAFTKELGNWYLAMSSPVMHERCSRHASQCRGSAAQQLHLVGHASAIIVHCVRACCSTDLIPLQTTPAAPLSIKQVLPARMKCPDKLSSITAYWHPVHMTQNHHICCCRCCDSSKARGRGSSLDMF